MEVSPGPGPRTQPTPGSSRPSRLHHNAYVTTDLEATRHFYEDIIGLPLVATWAEVDQFPDRERVYCHTFFELSDGSALAFFQFQDPQSEPPVAEQTSPSVHIALTCDEPTQRDILSRLRAEGINEDKAFLRDHGYCMSLYVRDPNGLRLEFTVDSPDMPDILEWQKASAHQTLTRWLAGDHASNNTYRPEH
jgi:glyoxylase I family protein